MRSEYFSLSGNEIATLDHAMNVLTRMPYLELLEFAGAVGGDADKMADAARQWTEEKAAKEKYDAE